MTRRAASHDERRQYVVQDAELMVASDGVTMHARRGGIVLLHDDIAEDLLRRKSVVHVLEWEASQ